MNFIQRTGARIVRTVGQMTGLSSGQLGQILSNANTHPRMGSKQLLQGYSTMPWFRAVVGKVGTSVAGTQWQLFAATQKPTKGYLGPRPKAIRRRSLARSMDPVFRHATYKALRAEESLREIVEHPYLDLMDHGNPRFPGQTVMALTQQHLDMVGECAWILDKNRLKLPSDVWPIPPVWVNDFPREGVRDTYFVVAPQGSRDIPQDQMLFFYHPNPADPYGRGSGIGHTLGDELETDEFAAKHLKSWFYNRARPDVLITAEGLTLPNMERLEQEWLRRLQGVKNTNKPFFVNRKVDVHELSQTFQEMQLPQIRRDERDIIMHVYGMPPEIFGILEHSNRATIDAADYLFARYVLVPRLEFLRIMLQIHVVERYDERLILDYVSPVQSDRDYELKVMTASPGSFEVDEFREQAGKPPKEDGSGKGHFIAANMMYVPLLQDAAELPEEPDEPEDPKVPGVGDKEDEDEDDD